MDYNKRSVGDHLLDHIEAGHYMMRADALDSSTSVYFSCFDREWVANVFDQEGELVLEEGWFETLEEAADWAEERYA
jgi:hypothetical protein